MTAQFLMGLTIGVLLMTIPYLLLRSHYRDLCNTVDEAIKRLGVD